MDTIIHNLQEIPNGYNPKAAVSIGIASSVAFGRYVTPTQSLLAPLVANCVAGLPAALLRLGFAWSVGLTTFIVTAIIANKVINYMAQRTEA